MGSNHEKNGGRKSRDTLPLSKTKSFLNYSSCKKFLKTFSYILLKEQTRKSNISWNLQNLTTHTVPVPKKSTILVYPYKYTVKEECIFQPTE